MLKKRAILASALLQFSPDVQSIRNKALEKIIIHFIAELENDCDNKAFTYVSPIRIRDAFSNEYGYSLSLLTIQEIADSLVNKNYLETDNNKPKNYCLALKTRDEFNKDIIDGDRLLQQTVKTLFPNLNPDEIPIYTEGFLWGLCLIFSENQEIALTLMRGTSTEPLLKGNVISRISEAVVNEFRDVDLQIIKSGFLSFFSKTSDPDYSRIKWNLAQYLHTAKALGLDNNGKYLSSEMFKGATFYLDTNILIPALEETHKHNRTFKAISQACEKISAEIRVAEITVKEMENWIFFQKDNFEKVIGKIPQDTLPKVRSLFVEKYSEKVSAGETDIKVADLFEPFNDCSVRIKEDLNIEIDQDSWFEENNYKPTILELAKNMALRYKEKRGREKKTAQAQHDALLLTFINNMSVNMHNNSFLISTDLSLTEGKWPNIPKTPVISLDGLLQWLAPLTADNYDSFAELFSQMIKQKLLPTEKFFDIEDFNIFAEIEMNSLALPAEDVEGCISHLKANGVNLNPRKAEDRENLFYEMRKYFSDPGREYKGRLEELTTRNAELKRLFENQETLYREKEKQRNDEFQRIISEKDKKIELTMYDHSELKTEFNNFKVKIGALFRLIVSFLILMCFEIVIILLALKYGEGSNVFQKIVKSLPLIFGGIGASGMIGYLIIGKDKLKILGWEVKNIFKP